MPEALPVTIHRSPDAAPLACSLKLSARRFRSPTAPGSQEGPGPDGGSFGRSCKHAKTAVNQIRRIHGKPDSATSIRLAASRWPPGGMPPAGARWPPRCPLGPNSPCYREPRPFALIRMERPGRTRPAPARASTDPSPHSRTPLATSNVLMRRALASCCSNSPRFTPQMNPRASRRRS